MDRDIHITREEAFQLLESLWLAYELLLGSNNMVEAMECLQGIEQLELKLWG